MGQIDRTGTFRGIDVNRGISYSSGGHVQWIADLQAVEYYDEDAEQWVDWSGYEESEIRCWLMLFDKDESKEPYLNTTQLLKAGRWTALANQELRQEPPENLLFQFRVELNTYKNDGSFKVTWVDHYDAVPGRTLEGLDEKEAKKLDAKHAAKIRKLTGGPKPKSVPAKPPIPKPEIPTPIAPGQPVQTATVNPELAAALLDKESAKAAMKAEMEEKAARGKAAETKAKRGRPPKSKPQAPKAEICTLNEAYDACYAVKPEDVSDDKLNTLWLDTIDKYGDQDTLSGAEWVTIRDEVIAGIS